MDNEIVKENHKRNCKIVMNFTRIREHEHEIYILKNKNEDLSKNIRELKQKNNIIEKKRKKLKHKILEMEKESQSVINFKNQNKLFINNLKNILEPIQIPTKINMGSFKVRY